MSIEVEMPTNEGQIRAELERIRSAETRRRLNGALGKRVEIVVRGHFAKRPRNKKGWPSQGFWRRRMRNATALASYDHEGAEVRIADPAINQKVFGGTITPKEGKYLTIPARPEANGRSPRTFSDLRFVPLRGRGRLRGMLVRTRQTFVKNRKQVGGEVFYWCVTQVTQAADPDALPSQVELDTAITDETGRFFAREWKRSGGGR